MKHIFFELNEWNANRRMTQAPFTLLRFCYDAFLLHQSYPLTLLRFFGKKRREKVRFCAFTLICLITNTEPKIYVFVRSHCSGFVKLVVGYWSVFKNLRFCAFTLIKCVFENLRFCGVFVQISVNTYTKTEFFLSVFVQKRSCAHEALAIFFVIQQSYSFAPINIFASDHL